MQHLLKFRQLGRRQRRWQRWHVSCHRGSFIGKYKFSTSAVDARGPGIFPAVVPASPARKLHSWFGWKRWCRLSAFGIKVRLNFRIALITCALPFNQLRIVDCNGVKNRHHKLIVQCVGFFVRQRVLHALVHVLSSHLYENEQGLESLVETFIFREKLMWLAISMADAKVMKLYEKNI